MKQFTLIFLLSLCAFLGTAFAFTTPPVKPYQHAKDFSWVSGQLHYEGVEGETWVVIYEAENQSKLLLVKENGELFQPPAGLKDGDMVKVFGAIKPVEVSITMMGQQYIVKSIKSIK